MPKQLRFTPIAEDEARARWDTGATICHSSLDYGPTGLLGYGGSRAGARGDRTFDSVLAAARDGMRAEDPVYWYGTDDVEEKAA
jgi:hypothetical protein